MLNPNSNVWPSKSSRSFLRLASSWACRSCHKTSFKPRCPFPSTWLWLAPPNREPPCASCRFHQNDPKTKRWKEQLYEFEKDSVRIRVLSSSDRRIGSNLSWNAECFWFGIVMNSPGEDKRRNKNDATQLHPGCNRSWGSSTGCLTDQKASCRSIAGDKWISVGKHSFERFVPEGYLMARTTHRKSSMHGIHTGSFARVSRSNFSAASQVTGNLK